jgi:hypothetical protein
VLKGDEGMGGEDGGRCRARCRARRGKENKIILQSCFTRPLFSALFAWSGERNLFHHQRQTSLSSTPHSELECKLN